MLFLNTFKFKIYQRKLKLRRATLGKYLKIDLEV